MQHAARAQDAERRGVSGKTQQDRININFANSHSHLPSYLPLQAYVKAESFHDTLRLDETQRNGHSDHTNLAFLLSRNGTGSRCSFPLGHQWLANLGIGEFWNTFGMIPLLSLRCEFPSARQLFTGHYMSTSVAKDDVLTEELVIGVVSGAHIAAGKYRHGEQSYINSGVLGVLENALKLV